MVFLGKHFTAEDAENTEGLCNDAYPARRAGGYLANDRDRGDRSFPESRKERIEVLRWDRDQ